MARGALSVATHGPARDRRYAAQVARVPVFADYQEKTTRKIPVVILEPA
jgi:hypothetical protein